jgi:hypothetical protein
MLAVGIQKFSLKNRNFSVEHKFAACPVFDFQMTIAQ